ncbi:hypothetical protein DICSQDRAFT_167269 [Dichomitus squalens LYAD-421 SS1]|uniref:uncharacterized protein n=1 Tax=Dichomitus squalens (strain LYAD-421) TaxID=732165 RepID=UPI0004410FFF|nr:uncharacterized protein DICSQDRAFT_167269 [Dichomitus squalens LYAD-421 SS1]EJF64100.1 hypothetical protein DICSQDRAFT_167269 [Dichomitus squalens LYAD-421 SS1]
MRPFSLQYLARLAICHTIIIGILVSIIRVAKKHVQGIPEELLVISFFLLVFSALDLGSRIVAPIEEADVHLWYDGMETSPVFFDFLAPFGCSLKKLTVWWADLRNVDPPNEVACRFPLVHTL